MLRESSCAVPFNLAHPPYEKISVTSALLLYYITDRMQFPGDEAERRQQLLSRISEAAAYGVNYIQLREKDLSIRELECVNPDPVYRTFVVLARRRSHQEPTCGNRDQLWLEREDQRSCVCIHRGKEY